MAPPWDCPERSSKKQSRTATHSADDHANRVAAFATDVQLLDGVRGGDRLRDSTGVCDEVGEKVGEAVGQ
jgi:hypothetical protein